MFTIEYLRDINIVSIFFRIILAIIIGGLLGFERGRKNRPAGFRTYMLVCLGSALVMMTNQYVYVAFHTSDPARLGAQVVSGIGFLGAGTIIVTRRNQIRGLTTAAGLWTAACCGLAIGIGFYEGAILGGITIFIVMSSMRRVDTYIRKHATIVEFYIEFESKSEFGNFLKYVREHSIEITDMEFNKNEHVKEGGISVIVSVQSSIKRHHSELLSIINLGPGIIFIQEL